MSTITPSVTFATQIYRDDRLPVGTSSYCYVFSPFINIAFTSLGARPITTRHDGRQDRPNNDTCGREKDKRRTQPTKGSLSDPASLFFLLTALALTATVVRPTKQEQLFLQPSYGQTGRSACHQVARCQQCLKLMCGHTPEDRGVPPVIRQRTGGSPPDAARGSHSRVLCLIFVPSLQNVAD